MRSRYVLPHLSIMCVAAPRLLRLFCATVPSSQLALTILCYCAKYSACFNLQEANALHLAQAEIEANLPAKRESQRHALGAQQRIVLQSTDSTTSCSHFSTVSTMPPASHVHHSANPHPSRSQRFLHQQTMQYPSNGAFGKQTGAFGKTLPIDPYLRHIGSSGQLAHVASASRPI